MVLEICVKTDGQTQKEPDYGTTIRKHLINNSFIFHPKLTAITLRLPAVKLP